MSIGVIGGGSVGTCISIILAKMGFEVTLIESNEIILGGAPIASFINHGDGFEYYKPGHQITGTHCIDGAIVKSLLFPKKDFSTNIISKDNPIRFYVSKTSNNTGQTPLKQFYENAKFMSNHFAQQYDRILNQTDFSNNSLKGILGRSPDSFYSILGAEDLIGIEDVIGGCAGSSYGVDMSEYYATIMGAIIKYNVSLRCLEKVNSIIEIGSNVNVSTNLSKYKFEYVFNCTSHALPEILLNSKIENHTVNSSGTFFLNAMTILEFAEGLDAEIINQINKINFTLQGENGCMFACIKKPSASVKGYAAIYFPSIIGSQLFNNIFDKRYPIRNPSIWDELIKNGIKSESGIVGNVLEQASRFYPIPIRYAKVLKTFVRPVFNIDTKASRKGFDRRVREISGLPIIESSNNRVSYWASPKWTNCELVALNAVNHFLSVNKMQVIPKHHEYGFGPQKLDLSSMLQSFNFDSIIESKIHRSKYRSIQGLSQSEQNEER